MTASGHSARDLAERLAACRREWLPRYAPAGRFAKKSGRDVYLLGGADGHAGGSMPVPMDPAKRVFVDYDGSFKGDDLDLMRELRGGTPGEAFKEAIEYLGLNGATTSPRPRPRPAPVAEPTGPKRPPTLSQAVELFSHGQIITIDSVGGRYLTGRLCAMPHPEGDLRWLPNHRHPCGWSGACLLALVTDPVTMEPITLHRTWVTVTGKAPIEKPRMYWPGPKEHGVCRLWPDEEVTLGLLVGEGLETCLSAALGFQPVWSCLDAGGLRAFPHLPGIDHLTIVQDHDDAGAGASVALRDRWLAAGTEAKIAPAPMPGEDLNDFAVRIANGGAP